MDEFWIHTFGGGSEVLSVLRFLQWLFASDSRYLTSVGTWSLSLGATLVIIKTALKGDIGSLGRFMLNTSLVFVFLFGAKATVWVKDEVSIGKAPVAVKGIPFAVAFVAGMSSHISFALTEMIEANYLNGDKNVYASNTGVMFGANVVSKLKDIQIRDPLTLRNTKEFVRQCYMLPYVIGDFGGLKGKAIKSTDILEFLSEYPAKNFGIYYNAPGKGSEFKKCSAAIGLIKADLAKEMGNGFLTQIGITSGLKGASTKELNDRIKATAQDTLKFLETSNSDVHNWMRQAMILNANRESLDDWRESFKMNRLYPQLVAAQSTRGLFQESIGNIISAEGIATLLPIVHGCVTTLLIALFIVVVSLALLPNGLGVLKLWATWLACVGSWPVFFAIVHCMSMNNLIADLASFGEEGLSLIGQGGFSEIVLYRYATSQKLVAMVPIIAWAIFKACAYSGSQIMSGLASFGAAAGLGAAAVDNRIDLANVSFGNKTRGQIQHEPNSNISGGRIDDGELLVTTTGGGGQIITEHVDSLGTNYRASESINSVLSGSLSSSQNKLANLTDSYNRQTTVIDEQAVDFARSFASGNATSSGISASSLAALKAGFSKESGVSEATSEGTTNSSGNSTNVGLKLPGASAFGLDIGTSSTSSKSHDIKQDMTATEREAFNTALEEVKQVAKNDDYRVSNSEDSRLGQSLKSNINKQETIGQQIGSTQQEIDTISQNLTWSTQNSGTIDRNVNDKVLEQVVKNHPEIRNKAQAVQWMNSHRAETDAIARPIVSGAVSRFTVPGKDYSNPEVVNSEIKSVHEAGNRARNSIIPPQESLEEKYRQKAADVEKQATVTDEYGNQRQVMEVVKSANRKSSGLNLEGDAKAQLENRLTTDGEKENWNELKKSSADEKTRGSRKFKEKGLKEAYDATRNKPVEDHMKKVLGNDKFEE